MMLIPNPSTALTRSRFPLISWVALGLALSFDFLAFTLQVTSGILAPNLMHDLHLGATSVSVISSCYFFAYAFMQIPVGILLDRIGPRWLMTTALWCCALGALLFSLGNNATVLSLAQVLMGGSAAFAYVSVLFIALSYFPTAAFGLLVGVAELTGSLGALLGQRPLLYFEHYFNWREWMFMVAVVSLLLSLLVMLVMGAPGMRVAKPKRVIRRIHRHVWLQLNVVLRRQRTWVIGGCALLFWAPAIIFGSLWGIPFLRVHYGLSVTAAANQMMFLWLGTAVGAPCLGWLSSYVRPHKTVLVWSAYSGLIISLLLLYCPMSNTLWQIALLFGLGFSASATCLTFALVQRVTRKMCIGTAMGFNNMMVVLGGPMGQLLAGWMLDLSRHHYQQGIPVYSDSVYQYALLTLPLCFGLAAWLAQSGLPDVLRTR